VNPLHAMLKNNAEGHEDYPYPRKYYIENYLQNNLGFKNKNGKHMGLIRFDKSKVDVNTEYYYNNFGFRDNDWIDSSDILAVGCSHTFGSGIPIEGSWTNILQNKMDQNVRNLSRPGASIQELVYQIFAYFEVFGNPKTIICLFPDPFRMLVGTKKNLAIVKDLNNDEPYMHAYLEKYTNLKISERKKHLKMPFDYEQIIPMEFALLNSTRSIHMLEQYCNSNNIKLMWSSWYRMFSNVMKELDDNSFKNFFYNKEFFPDSSYSNCHQEYEEMFTKYFNNAQDVEYGPGTHPGVHWHSHVADAFYEELNK